MAVFLRIFLPITIVVFALGLVLYLTSSLAIRELVSTQLIISPNAPALYSGWLKLPYPMYTSIYLFNVTNAEAVEKHGAQPLLLECGPYVFLEKHEKTHVQFHVQNFSVSYQQLRTYHFVPEKSNNYSLSDLITTLNPMAVMVGEVARQESELVRIAINMGVKLLKEELFVTKNVSQLLFEGFTDPILSLTDNKLIPSSVVPKKMDKFGYFYPKNNSDVFDGVFNIYTGEDNIKLRGQMNTWNYSQFSHAFPQCGKIEGATEFFTPLNHDLQNIDLFSPDLCRSIKLDLDKDDSIDGVAIRDFIIKPDLFANSTMNVDNMCYNDHVLPSGVFNASSCQFGVPIFMSQPHFYQADQHYVNAVNASGGINPTKEKHGTLFRVEPYSGLPVEVRARFQINFYLRPVHDLELMKNVPELMFPTAWFETRVDFQDSKAMELWLMANVKNMMQIAGILLLTVAIMAVVGIAIVTVRNRNNDVIAHQILISEDETETEQLAGNRRNVDDHAPNESNVLERKINDAEVTVNV